jgi:hypothetical protein
MRLLLVLLLVLPAIARASNPSLADARKAVDEIRYDDARELLVQALKQGGNRPDELVEIYRLSAATAVVLGPADLAEQYYRRMLALDPDATLPQDASPRLREPFIAAQAYMAAQQRFEAKAARTAKGIDVTIVDPLGMVVAVAVLEAGELRNKQPFAGQPITLVDGDDPADPGKQARADAGNQARAGTQVVALDEHGNFLRIIELPIPVVADEPIPPRTPFFRHWLTWTVPAVAATGATTFFFYDARRAHDRLDTLLADSSGHYFDEAEAERRHWRRSTIIGWVGVGVTAALATTAIVMATRRPRAMTVTPSVGSDSASVQLEAKF